jgi:hypothetical protein
MEKLSQVIGNMAPDEALAEITEALKKLFSSLDDEARSQFLWNLIGESQGDKVSSLVNL